MVNDMASIVTCLGGHDRADCLAGTPRAPPNARASLRRRSRSTARCLFTNDDGETFVPRAGSQFELLHVNRIGESTLASPALVDGR